MTHRTMQVPVVSTAHITRQDADLLSKAEPGLPSNQAPHGFMGPLPGGWLFYIGYIEPTCYVAQGFSEAFACLIQHAQHKGQTYLRLDQDGDILKDLPTHEW